MLKSKVKMIDPCYSMNFPKRYLPASLVSDGTISITALKPKPKTNEFTINVFPNYS